MPFSSEENRGAPPRKGHRAGAVPSGMLSPCPSRTRRPPGRGAPLLSILQTFAGAELTPHTAHPSQQGFLLPCSPTPRRGSHAPDSPSEHSSGTAAHPRRIFPPNLPIPSPVPPSHRDAWQGQRANPTHSRGAAPSGAAMLGSHLPPFLPPPPPPAGRTERGPPPASFI